MKYKTEITIEYRDIDREECIETLGKVFYNIFKRENILVEEQEECVA